MKLSFFAMLLLAFSATTAVAAETQAAAKSQSGNSNSGLVCFSEKVTGSNLRKRICMTEEERERMRKQDQEAVGNLKNSSAGKSRSNNGSTGLMGR